MFSYGWSNILSDSKIPSLGQRDRTVSSFEYQWHQLPSGAALLSDPNWRNHVVEYILDELSMRSNDLRNKSVLDAGCGSGRWSYGFASLGCKVYGFDTSKSGIAYAQSAVPLGQFNVANILDKKQIDRLYAPEQFAVIWVWGVLHHTGDPELGLRNLVPLLKRDGVLHLYLYGRKSRTNHLFRACFNCFSLAERIKLAQAFSWAVCLRLFLEKLVFGSLSQKRASLGPIRSWHRQFAHSMFDAFSPPIAQECNEVDVKTWFRKLGLSYERVHPKWAGRSTDLFVNGRKLL